LTRDPEKFRCQIPCCRELRWPRRTKPVIARLDRAIQDEIKRRIGEAAKYADGDQLCLSPQCGFASTEEGNKLAEDEQWAKLAMIVEVADEVWG
jgi:hypothetical protein